MQLDQHVGVSNGRGLRLLFGPHMEGDDDAAVQRQWPWHQVHFVQPLMVLKMTARDRKLHDEEEWEQSTLSKEWGH